MSVSSGTSSPLSAASMIGGCSSAAVRDARVIRCETVRPPSTTSRLELGPLDGFNMRLWYIESTHFFPGKLDAVAVRSSLEGLLARYPSFAGRVKRTCSHNDGGAQVERRTEPKNVWVGYEVVVDESSGIPLLEIALSGTSKVAANDRALWHSRGLANIPALSEVINGAEETMEDQAPPLMTVVLADFAEGGSALAVAINHGLVDGKGYAELLKTWSRAHCLGWDHSDVPALEVKRPQCLLHPTVAPTSGDLFCDTRTQLGCEAFCKTIEPLIRSLSGRARARIYFSWAELRAFKASTSYNGQRKKETPTSTEALAARVWCAFSKLLLPPSPTRWAIQPTMLTQMRSPRHSEIPRTFLGNCVQGLYSPAIQVDDQASDLRTLLCTGFHDAGALMADDEVSKSAMAEKLSQKISNFQAGVWGSPTPQRTEKGVGVNAMQSFRVFGLDFGAGNALGYIPNNLGNNMQIEETVGGVNVLLQVPHWAASTAPSDWLEQVESPSFRCCVTKNLV